jgi:hypothetical protein
MSTGRGSPEIDALEAQKNKLGDGGKVSQSAQFAPFSYNYTFDMTHVSIADPSLTAFNEYRGSAVWVSLAAHTLVLANLFCESRQQAVSALTTLPDDIYQQTQGNFQTFGFEYNAHKSARDQAYINWISSGVPSLSMTAGAVGPDEMAQISARLVPEEPMVSIKLLAMCGVLMSTAQSIVMNLAISESFQKVDQANMVFPSELKIDYVRVYQRKGEKNVGCDPKDYPTTQYIADHLDVYTSKCYVRLESDGVLMCFV